MEGMGGLVIANQSFANDINVLAHKKRNKRAIRTMNRSLEYEGQRSHKGHYLNKLTRFFKSRDTFKILCIGILDDSLKTVFILLKIC